MKNIIPINKDKKRISKQEKQRNKSNSKFTKIQTITALSNRFFKKIKKIYTSSDFNSKYYLYI